MSQRPGGVSQYFNPDGTMVEAHTSTCKHCSKMTEFPDKRRMLEHVDICRQCMGLICLECVGKPCMPWQRRLDEMEKRYWDRRRMMRDMGLEK